MIFYWVIKKVEISLGNIFEIYFKDSETYSELNKWYHYYKVSTAMACCDFTHELECLSIWDVFTFNICNSRCEKVEEFLSFLEFSFLLLLMLVIFTSKKQFPHINFVDNFYFVILMHKVTLNNFRKKNLTRNKWQTPSKVIKSDNFIAS